jgi:Ala-tRNA(Pro) deacylase
MGVPEFLAERQVPFETLLHPPAFTAQKRARFLHLPGRQVAKVVLLHGPDGYLLAVLAATDRVATESVAQALGGPVRLADDTEIADIFPDCEWGVVPPFGTLYGLPVLLDERIAPEALLVFETTRHVEAVRMRCRDFERLEHPRRLPLARSLPTG